MPLKISGRNPFDGASAVNVSPATLEEYSVEGVKDGVILAEVPQGSTAGNVGLQKGDVIVAVNDRKIERTSDLRAATNVGRQVYWKLMIFRNGQTITSVIGG